MSKVENSSTVSTSNAAWLVINESDLIQSDQNCNDNAIKIQRDDSVIKSIYGSFLAESQKLKTHSILILIACILILIWFVISVLIWDILPQYSIDSIEYGSSEFTANSMILIYSFYIWYRYIHKIDGKSLENNCTNFDLYAILSLLWLLTTSILFIVYSKHTLALLQIWRMFSFIIPGYIHKFYIRSTNNNSVNAYLGDIKVFKIVSIVFYAIQLLANVVQIPLNQIWFDETISTVFELNMNSHEHYHLPFIIAAVFGRPFLSMLLFHSLMLFITWFLNGDKPILSHHNQDLFSLWYDESSFNINVGLIMIVLFVFDLTLHIFLWYDLLFLLIYVIISVLIVSYVALHYWYLNDLVKIHETDHGKHESKHVSSDSGIDRFELMESLFVLVCSVIAILCYCVNISDFVHEYSAWCKLFGFLIFILAQYVCIIYLQFNDSILNLNEFARKLLRFSGMISAISIMYCFLFEYDHFLDILSETHDTASHLLQASYSLFWCLLEYFIWSFVTVNHMLHKNQHASFVEERNGDIDHDINDDDARNNIDNKNNNQSQDNQSRLI